MTTLDAAEEWLRRRLVDTPPELAADVVQLVRGVADESADIGADAVAWLLARAGLAGIDEIVTGHGGRESALRLLSADAALTFAFEAAAVLGADVAALGNRLGPRGELGERLEGVADIGGAE